MTDKQHPAQFDWATELSDAQGRVTLSEQEAHEIGARLRSMGAKLNAYEDLDEAASDVQLLRTGYAAARLEIESLHAQLEAIGAGGVQALSAGPATPPAQQQATKETSGGFHVWRDISTAPKDGSRFVATGHNYGLYSEVRHTCVAQWFQGCWMEASDWNETSELKYLTHWMPLPSPPDDVAAPAEQQAAPKAAPTRTALPEGWTDCTIEFGNDGPEVVAYGPKRMMTRLAKWLGKYFAQVIADAATKAAPQQEAQEPVVHPRHPAAVEWPSDSEIDALVTSIGPTEGIRKDSRDLSMSKLRMLVRRALATWGQAKEAPAAQGDADLTDSWSAIYAARVAQEDK